MQQAVLSLVLKAISGFLSIMSVIFCHSNHLHRDNIERIPPSHSLGCIGKFLFHFYFSFMSSSFTFSFWAKQLTQEQQFQTFLKYVHNKWHMLGSIKSLDECIIIFLTIYSRTAFALKINLSPCTKSGSICLQKKLINFYIFFPDCRELPGTMLFEDQNWQRFCNPLMLVGYSILVGELCKEN